MTQQIKASTIKSDKMNSIPTTNMVDSHNLFSDFHRHVGSHYTNTQKINR